MAMSTSFSSLKALPPREYARSSVNGQSAHTASDVPQFMCDNAIDTVKYGRSGGRSSHNSASMSLHLNGSPALVDVVAKDNRKPPSVDPINTFTGTNLHAGLAHGQFATSAGDGATSTADLHSPVPHMPASVPQPRAVQMGIDANSQRTNGADLYRRNSLMGGPLLDAPDAAGPPSIDISAIADSVLSEIKGDVFDDNAAGHPTQNSISAFGSANRVDGNAVSTDGCTRAVPSLLDASRIHQQQLLQHQTCQLQPDPAHNTSPGGSSYMTTADLVQEFGADVFEPTPIEHMFGRNVDNSATLNAVAASPAVLAAPTAQKLPDWLLSDATNSGVDCPRRDFKAGFVSPIEHISRDSMPNNNNKRGIDGAIPNDLSPPCTDGADASRLPSGDFAMEPPVKRQRIVSPSTRTASVPSLPRGFVSMTLPAAANATGGGDSRGNNNDDSTPTATDSRFRGYQEDQWNERYHELRNFIKANGHCQVPHRKSERESLSRWCKRQRYQYKLLNDGKPSTMTQERIAMLNAINFVWDSHATIWEERYGELRAYREKNGHCSIPSNYPPNQKLSTWVKCQRRQYKLYRAGQKSNMTLERIVRLNKLGFIWELRSHRSTSQD